MKASNRIRIGHALVAGFAFLAITLGNSAAVRADLIATFTSTATGNYVYTGGTTQSTLTTSTNPLSGIVGWGSSFTSVAGGAANITLNNIKSITAAVGNQQSGWSGSYTITQGTNSLTVSFTNALLTDTGSGGSATLASQTAPTGTTTITPSAGFGNPITQPESFAFQMTGVSLTGPNNGFGFADFKANDGNSTSASVVPEPSTMAIAGLGALGMIGYGLRRRKALGA